MSPVRALLLAESALQPRILDGLQGVHSAHLSYINEEIRTEFEDSLDLDEAMRRGNDQQNRWDYLLGHQPSLAVIGLEPHSATEGEISVVIAKRKAARDQLRPHMRGAKIAKWLWVASGKVGFLDTERAKRRLDQNGIEFVGKQVLRKHLPK